MSFSLNLSAINEAARDRLARLRMETSPGASLRDRLLSPPARTPPLVSFALPLSDGVGSSPVTSGEVDPSGEFPSLHLSDGGGGGLSVFVLTAELVQDMCCGAVSGGVKFCTLGASKCTFSSYHKKVAVLSDELYSAAPRNTAYSSHHVPVRLLSEGQLMAVLREQHPKDKWVPLLHALNSQSSDTTLSIGNPANGSCLSYHPKQETQIAS